MCSELPAAARSRRLRKLLAGLCCGLVLGFLAGRPVTQGTLPPPTATIRVKPAKGVDLVRRNAKEKVMKTKKFAQAGQSSGVSKLP